MLANFELESAVLYSLLPEHLRCARLKPDSLVCNVSRAETRQGSGSAENDGEEETVASGVERWRQRRLRPPWNEDHEV